MRDMSGQDWQQNTAKRVILFGMSGLGKTHISNILRATGDWFHYSVDYRIGTRYLGEDIDDNLKAAAMQQPFLRDQLMSDSVFIKSNISFNDLGAVSYYLGKPGNTALGGLEFGEYQRRQHKFKAAEMAALHDTPQFIERAHSLYNYANFVCDTGGSICEWVDAEDQNDPILSTLSDRALLVWIKGSQEHTQELVRRFDRAPKPMAYQPEFLTTTWNSYLNEHEISAQDADPNAFIRYSYARALSHRQPRYQAMADNWGITVRAEDLAHASTPNDVNDVIARALDHRNLTK